LDIRVGFWSDQFGKVVVTYLHSAFLGHADAEQALVEEKKKKEEAAEAL